MCNLTLGLNGGMGLLGYLLYPWGIILQGLAIVHFIRRRPDNYWIFVILFLGPLGAIIYLAAEALPDIGLLGQSFKVFPRRKRIRELEAAIRDNPSAGNYEELGDLYMDDGKLDLARAAFDKAIAARADTLDPFYRRGVCAIQLGDAAAALPDLERTVAKEPDYDFQRAAGLPLYREPATIRTQVLTCGAILGRAGRRLVIHLSESWGGLKTRTPLLDSILNWQIPTSPKLEPALVT